MRVLVIGGDSQVGAALAARLRDDGHEVTGTTRRAGAAAGSLVHLDLREPQTAELGGKQFDVVVICAAMTAMAACEEQPDECRKVNVDGPIALIDHFAQQGAFVVFLSSDGVFSGERPFYEADAERAPQNAYGRTKAAVEAHIESHSLKNLCAVVRLSKVVSDATPFIRKWRDAVARGAPFDCFTNRVLSPVPLDEVVDGLCLVIDRREHGTYQIGGNRELSYADFARELFAGDPRSLDLLRPVAAPGPQRRHNSLQTRLPAREAQYGALFAAERVTMGLMSGHSYLGDTKRLVFTLSRYKFVSKMMAGLSDVLEIGCADAFGSPIVLKEVGSLTCCDFDASFIADARRTHPYAARIDFRVHDFVRGPLGQRFEGAYCLDVFEHIAKADEEAFLSNIRASLRPDGVCIIGIPSLESQAYASVYSRLGHVNCQSGDQFRATLQKHFSRVFMFSMNDEVLHTGFFPMAHYLLALCCGVRTDPLPTRSK